MSNEQIDDPQKQFSDVRILNDEIINLSENYKTSVVVLENNIKEKTERFVGKDDIEFQAFLQKLEKENMEKLYNYFKAKAQAKLETFEEHNKNFQNEFLNLNQKMADFKVNLQQKYEIVDKRKKKFIQEIKNMMDKIQQRRTAYKVFTMWKNWLEEKKAQKQGIEYCRLHYTKNLFDKVFYSWKNITYKPAFEKRVKKTSDVDIVNIKQHYLEIIKVMKDKIAKLDDLISIKKQAKAEFAYSISRNLLKVISNLSVEVMSLNQVSLKDQKVDVSDTQKFLKEMNDIISNKCNEIQSLRQNIEDDLTNAENQKSQRVEFNLADQQDN